MSYKFTYHYILICVILQIVTFGLETPYYGGNNGDTDITIFDQGRISGILKWGYDTNWNGVVIDEWTSDNKTSSQRIGVSNSITECTAFQLAMDEYIDGVQVVYGPWDGMVRSISFHISNGNTHKCSIDTTTYNNIANKLDTGMMDISDIYLTGFKAKFGDVIERIGFQFKDRNPMIKVTDMFGGKGGDIINEMDKGRINAIYQWGYGDRPEWQYNGIIITNWTSDGSTIALDEFGVDYTGYCTGFVVPDNEYIDGYRVKYDGYVSYLGFHISDGNSSFCEVLPIPAGLTDTGWIIVSPTSYLTGIWAKTGGVIDQIVLQFTDILLIPTISPTWSPTDIPSTDPSRIPTKYPSNIPSTSPTSPTSPTSLPSIIPTISPSNNPTISPSNIPTVTPTNNPSNSPSRTPSNDPTKSPSDDPTKSPSHDPTISPTKHPIASTTDVSKSTTTALITTSKSGGDSDGKVDDRTTTVLLDTTDNTVSEGKKADFITENKTMINVIISCLVAILCFCCIIITYLYIKQSKRNDGRKTNVEMEKLEKVKSVSATTDIPSVATNINGEYVMNEGGGIQTDHYNTDNGDNINNLINNNNHNAFHQMVTPEIAPTLNTMHIDLNEKENNNINDDEEEEENDDLWNNSNVMTKGGEMNEIVTKNGGDDNNDTLYDDSSDDVDNDDTLYKKSNNKQPTAGNID